MSHRYSVCVRQRSRFSFLVSREQNKVIGGRRSVLSAALVGSCTHAGQRCSFVCLVIDCLWLKLADIFYVSMLSIVPAAWSWEPGERDRQRQRNLASSLRDCGVDEWRAGEVI